MCVLMTATGRPQLPFAKLHGLYNTCCGSFSMSGTSQGYAHKTYVYLHAEYVRHKVGSRIAYNTYVLFIYIRQDGTTLFVSCSTMLNLLY